MTQPMDIDTVMALLQAPAAELNKAEHAALYQARARASPEDQNRLAGPEHRAYARESTADNPLMALPIALSALAYQPYKMVAGQSRSDASLDQLLQGLTGVGEGLAGFGSKQMEQLAGLIKR